MHNYLKKNQTTEDSHSTFYFKLPTAYCKFYPFPPRHSCSGSREIMGCNWRRRCTLVLSKNTIVPRRTLASDVCCLLLKASSKGLLMLFKTHLWHWAGGRCTARLNHEGAVAMCTAGVLQCPAPGWEGSWAVLQWVCSSFSAPMESSSFLGEPVFPSPELYFCGNSQLWQLLTAQLPAVLPALWLLRLLKVGFSIQDKRVRMWWQAGPDLLMVGTD